MCTARGGSGSGTDRYIRRGCAFRPTRTTILIRARPPATRSYIAVAATLRNGCGLTTTVTVRGVAWRRVGKALTEDEGLGVCVCVGGGSYLYRPHARPELGTFIRRSRHSRHSRKFARVRSRRIWYYRNNTVLTVTL